MPIEAMSGPPLPGRPFFLCTGIGSSLDDSLAVREFGMASATVQSIAWLRGRDMISDTEQTVYILREGSVQEEAWQWTDVEAMCRAGRLSPECLVFFPKDNVWKRAIDTELSTLFEERSHGDVDGEADGDRSEIREEYEDLCQELASPPYTVEEALQAAQLALALDERQAAHRHLQQALDTSPYHPRVAREARRLLSPGEWKTLKRFERPPPITDNVLDIVTYPWRRGAVYVLAPTIALAVLSYIPWAGWLGIVFLYLWLVQTIRSSALRRSRPPLWHDLMNDPRHVVLRPLAVGCAAGLGIAAPLAVIAKALLMTGMTTQPDVISTIQNSPVLFVVAFTVSLVCVPGVLVLTAAPGYPLVKAVDPRRVVDVIRTMEREYLIAVGLLYVLVLARWAVSFVMNAVPVVGRLVSTLLAILIVLGGGLVLGRLVSRFRDELEVPDKVPLTGSELE